MCGGGVCPVLKADWLGQHPCLLTLRYPLTHVLKFCIYSYLPTVLLNNNQGICIHYYHEGELNADDVKEAVAFYFKHAYIYSIISLPVQSRAAETITFFIS